MLHHANRASLITTRDPNFRNVTLLLHGDGTNGGQNNTFIDGSTNNFTITRNGNTTQGTFSSYGTLWSNYFDGTGDHLNIASNAAFGYGTGDFTIEFWAFFSASNVTFFDQRSGVINQAAPAIFLDGSALSLYVSNAVVIAGANVSLNTWYHIALCRSGTSTRLFLNGAQTGSTFIDTTNYITSPVRIGHPNDGVSTNGMNGYMSNVRILKGTALYTSAFTPPTQPLTAITNTQLLTCQSNRFIDNSSNAFTITRNGDVRVQRFNPFNPPGEYSTSIIGGSGYFDGTGDSVTVANNSALQMGSGDFTLEAWVYYENTRATEQQIIATAFGYNLIITTGGRLAYFLSTNGTSWNLASFVDGGAVPIKQWNHCALVRSGSTFTPYVNGVAGTTTTSSSALFNFTSVVAMGASHIGTGPLLGYMTDIRIVKGTAVYTSNFTPPTAPLTAITNTQLLLNFTNAAIIDNAMMNDLETVGNAQISTSVRRFGTGSLAFDGTNDWLLIPHSVDQFFGTGNFTIEMWLYLATTGAVRGLVAKGTSTTGWLVSTNASNQVVFTFGTSTITSTGAISGTTWTHIAVVREGTGANQTKIYINGTNDGTGTVSTNFNQTNAMYVGADRTAGSATRLNGNIDDLRITNNIARYTANFTPPTVPFPNM